MSLLQDFLLRNAEIKEFIHQNISLLEPDDRWEAKEFNKTFKAIDVDQSGAIDKREMDGFFYRFYAFLFNKQVPKPPKNETVLVFEKRKNNTEFADTTLDHLNKLYYKNKTPATSKKKTVKCDSAKDKGDHGCQKIWGNGNCCMKMTIVGYTEDSEGNQRQLSDLSPKERNYLQWFEDLGYITQEGRTEEYCQDIRVLQQLIKITKHKDNQVFKYFDVPLYIKGVCAQAVAIASGAVAILSVLFVDFL